MNTQKRQTASSQTPQTNRRRWLFLGIGILLVGLSLFFAALWFKPLRPTTNLSAAVVSSSDSQTVEVNTVSQSASVRTNIAEHMAELADKSGGRTNITEHEAELASKPEAAVQDPAATSVLEYIRVHNSIPDGTTWQDPAVQGVMDYIRAHNSTSEGAAEQDPAVKSVMEYIRVHNSIPDGTAWGDPSADSK